MQVQFIFTIPSGWLNLVCYWLNFTRSWCLNEFGDILSLIALCMEGMRRDLQVSADRLMLWWLCLGFWKSDFVIVESESGVTKVICQTTAASGSVWAIEKKIRKLNFLFFFQIHFDTENTGRCTLLHTLQENNRCVYNIRALIAFTSAQTNRTKGQNKCVQTPNTPNVGVKGLSDTANI